MWESMIWCTQIGNEIKMAVLAFVHTMSNLESDGGYKGCFLCANCDSGENSHGRQPY